MIDWSVCKQPDLTNTLHTATVKRLVDKYVASAKSNKATNIAVGLNKAYGIAVQERRDHVSLNYIALGPQRTQKQCALSDQNYSKLLAYRDASYYVLCRSEVAIGANTSDRKLKDYKALAYAAIYDFLKSMDVDFRAKPDEPTTPPGGYAACRKGADDGHMDPFPSPQDITSFKTRLNLPESEKAKMGDPKKQ